MNRDELKDVVDRAVARGALELPSEIMPEELVELLWESYQAIYGGRHRPAHLRPPPEARLSKDAWDAMTAFAVQIASAESATADDEPSTVADPLHCQFTIWPPDRPPLPLDIPLRNDEAEALFGAAIGPAWRQSGSDHFPVLSRLTDTVCTVRLTPQDSEALLAELKQVRTLAEGAGVLAVSAWWKLTAVAGISAQSRSWLDAFSN